MPEEAVELDSEILDELLRLQQAYDLMEIEDVIETLLVASIEELQ